MSDSKVPQKIPLAGVPLSAARTPSDPLEISATLTCFACGQGDTLLLCLPGTKWVLIDSYLPEGAVREEFFQMLEQLGINRLDYVFQTHPDSDHFTGMRSILKYFSESGRSIGVYGDCGISAKQMKYIMGDRPESAEYERLQRYLDELFQDRKLKYAELGDTSEAIWPNGYEHAIVLMPVGPVARSKRAIMRAEVVKLVQGKASKLASNELSLVLVMSIGKGDNIKNCLLAADATTKAIGEAIEVWRRRSKEIGRCSAFVAVKVPHHGSFASHSKDVCNECDASGGIAVVTCGTERALPDRRVLRDYMDAGWSVALTTRRTKRLRDRPFTLAGGGKPAVVAQTSNVDVAISTSCGVVCKQSAALIAEKDLEYYEEAAG